MADRKREARDERIERTVSEFILIAQDLLEMMAMPDPAFVAMFEATRDKMIDTLQSAHYRVG